MHELHDYYIHYSTHLFKNLLDNTPISRQPTICWAVVKCHFPLLNLQLELVPAALVPVGGQPPHLVLQPLRLRVPGGEDLHQVNLGEMIQDNNIGRFIGDDIRS